MYVIARRVIADWSMNEIIDSIRFPWINSAAGFDHFSERGPLAVFLKWHLTRIATSRLANDFIIAGRFPVRTKCITPPPYVYWVACAPVVLPTYPVRALSPSPCQNFVFPKSPTTSSVATLRQREVEGWAPCPRLVTPNQSCSIITAVAERRFEQDRTVPAPAQGFCCLLFDVSV